MPKKLSNQLFAKRDLLISLFIAFWLTLLGSLAKPGTCFMIGTTCPHKRGYPLVWYEMKDYFGKDVTTNYENILINFLIWFSLSIIIVFFAKKLLHISRERYAKKVK